MCLYIIILKGKVNDNDNDNDNGKVFYSTLIIHFILHITVINVFAY